MRIVRDRSRVSVCPVNTRAIVNLDVEVVVEFAQLGRNRCAERVANHPVNLLPLPFLEGGVHLPPLGGSVWTATEVFGHSQKGIIFYVVGAGRTGDVHCILVEVDPRRVGVRPVQPVRVRE